MFIKMLSLFVTSAALSLPIAALAPSPRPSATPSDVFMCDSDIECEEATGIPLEVAMAPDNYPKYPGLVGIGCEGTNGSPIYAYEEDHFPSCRAIFAMDWEI